MISLFKRTTDSSSRVSIERDQFERVLKISQNLLASLYQFDRQSVWVSITEEIRRLYGCELVSLFLVDEEDPEYLVMKAQCPSPTKHEKVRLRITSEPGQGITGHAAKEGKAIILDHRGIKSNIHISNRRPTYLPSGICYSVLLAPLKNRKGKLLGVLRLHNKGVAEPSKQDPFTSADKSTIEFLAVEIVALLENAHAFDALRALIEDVQKAGSTEKAVQCILTCAARLIQASHAKLGLWSQALGRLVFAGAKNLGSDKVQRKGEEIPANNIMVALWKSVIERPEHVPNDSVSDDEVWLNSGPQKNPDLRCCEPNTKSSISVVLRVHQEPVGVLHLESFEPKGFDDLDRQTIKALAQNVSIAIQSITVPWRLESGHEGLSLGEAKGLFQSVVEHIPRNGPQN